jgi:hypothetical protein
MSVAPIEYGDDGVELVPVTDEQYALALESQRLGRSRTLRLVLDSAAPDSGESVDVSMTSVAQAEQSFLMTRLALLMLERELRTTAGKKEVQEILTKAWPWTRHLPNTALIAMVDELGQLLLAPKAPDRDDAATQLLIEWEHTAEVHADPALHAILTREYNDADDFGPVPIPDEREGEDVGR